MTVATVPAPTPVLMQQLRMSCPHVVAEIAPGASGQVVLDVPVPTERSPDLNPLTLTNCAAIDADEQSMVMVPPDSAVVIIEVHTDSVSLLLFASMACICFCCVQVLLEESVSELTVSPPPLPDAPSPTTTTPRLPTDAEMLESVSVVLPGSVAPPAGALAMKGTLRT